MDQERKTESKWGKETLDNQNLIKLLKLRKVYDNKYKTRRGFAKEGWHQIALEIGKNPSSCRKRFIDLVNKYKVINLKTVRR
jgi:hypothetical protein